LTFFSELDTLCLKKGGGKVCFFFLAVFPSQEIDLDKPFVAKECNFLKVSKK